MINDSVFYLGIVMLIVHELDAVYRMEWRIFPFLKKLDDGTGFKIFILIHIPILFLLLWLNTRLVNETKFWFQFSLDLFLILHLGLHFLFKKEEKNLFNNRFSNSIIFITALVGALHLLLLVNTH